MKEEAASPQRSAFGALGSPSAAHHIPLHPTMSAFYPPAEASHREVCADPALFFGTLDRLLGHIGIVAKVGPQAWRGSHLNTAHIMEHAAPYKHCITGSDNTPLSAAGGSPTHALPGLLLKSMQHAPYAHLCVIIHNARRFPKWRPSIFTSTAYTHTPTHPHTHAGKHCTQVPKVGGQQIDIHRLYVEVTHRGGCDNVTAHKLWVAVCEPFKVRLRMCVCACVWVLNWVCVRACTLYTCVCDCVTM